MFSHQPFITAIHTIQQLPDNFPNSAAEFLNLLENNKAIRRDSLDRLITSLKESELFTALSNKVNNDLANLSFDEMICYALGSTTNPQDLQNVLTTMSNTESFKSHLTNPEELCAWYDKLPIDYFRALSQFFFSTDAYAKLKRTMDTAFMALTPHEFFFVLMYEHYHIRDNKKSTAYKGRVMQYLQNSQTAFGFIAHAPCSIKYLIACELRFSQRYHGMAADWMLNPLTDKEAVLFAMFTPDIKLIDVSRLTEALKNLFGKYSDTPVVTNCLQGVRATLAFADPDNTDNEWLAYLRNHQTYVNLSGANLEGADFSRCKLGYALVAPEKIDHDAQWRVRDRHGVWNSINPASLVNLCKANLRSTQLPLCLGYTKVSLDGANLEDSSIFAYPFLSNQFKLNGSLFNQTEPQLNDPVAEYCITQLNRIQLNIATMSNTRIPERFAYVEKAKGEHAGKTKSKHVAAKLIGDYFASIQDNVNASTIYQAAKNHPLFTHANIASRGVDKIFGLFSSDFGSDSQDILKDFFVIEREKRLHPVELNRM